MLYIVLYPTAVLVVPVVLAFERPPPYRGVAVACGVIKGFISDRDVTITEMLV